MFSTFFFNELKYTLKQPMVYIFMLIMALLVFGATASDNVQIGGSVGNIVKNAPFVITTFTAIMSIFGLLIAAAFFNNAALRDYNNQFNEILFSTPLSKSGYYFGRFFGALIISTIPLLGVFIGVIMGSFVAPLVGWEDPSRYGDFYLETFVNNYFLFILPNMFFAGTIIYSMAMAWKSTVISFVGAMVIIVAYIVSGTLMSDIDNETIGAIFDTFGIRTYSLTTKYYTPIEKNTVSPVFGGLLLLNRVIWIAFGSVVLVASYLRFSFLDKGKKVKAEKKEAKVERGSFSLPKLNPQYGRATDWIHFKSFFKTNFLSIRKSVTFKILFVFSAILLVSSLWGGFEYFGLQSYPLTYEIIDAINGSVLTFIIIILVFFSGELVWRDRDSKINEVVDATPHNSIISLAAKALSLVAIASLLNWFFILCGILYQLANGFTRIELDVYFIDFLFTNLSLYFVWAGVMIMIQVLVNNKYMGYFISILVLFLWRIFMSMFDIQSNMLQVAGGPSLRYSDMSGFGPGVYGAIWFNLYWGLFSVLSLMIAGALWNRGSSSSLMDRIQIMKKQVPKSFRSSILLVGFVWALVAGFVYYNTQVLNDYKTSDETEELFADYEKKFKKYENVDLPKLTDIKYFIDIFPKERDVHVRAVMQVTNETNNPIDSLHYNYGDDWVPEFKIPNSEMIMDDPYFGYRIYKISPAIQPGETIEIEIKTKNITQGFGNGTGNTSVLENGTFINNMSILPSLGYNAGIELSDKNTRKKYDLEPKDRMPELEVNCGENCRSNYLTNGHSDYINAETVISTSDDQMAIAPGSLIKEWNEDGRNYYHYKVDHISQDFYAFISAKYVMKTRKWNGVDIEVYYDEKHDVNVDMMLDAVERSLTYYSENFGPYFHKQCRVIEFPRYATFAQAFPGTMPYSEAFGFVVNLEDESDNNVIDAVIAHEMAHQWWAHQVVGAGVQGGTMMSESFSEYSSLMTMKSITENPMKMRDFIKYDHDRYLRGRGGERVKELPLYKVENQQYIHYGKGSVILYALQDYIGEDSVNKAMRTFLEEYRYKKPPYPTSLDFLRHLDPVVPDSMKYLVEEWFKEITLYDNRLTDATYSELENGKFAVTMRIETTKIKADSLGNETKVAMNDWIDIGLFADDDEDHLMYQKRVKFDQPEMTFTMVVDSLPAKAGIDPRHILIDRVYSDNIKSVKLAD
ncbi:MAG: ABC-2 type transport system permease protein [Salibacteraceae bacterium]|jgi:ABC-2 type transport system permease protein